jgi:hypothetical protein
MLRARGDCHNVQASLILATMNDPRFLPESIRRDLQWVSAFSRLAIGGLLLSAGILKLPGGVSGTIAYYSSLFEHSLLPGFLVRAHASAILFVELALGIWLLTGYRLAIAWKVAATLLTSLAIGMLFAGKYDVASDNYVYVVLSLGSLLVSRYDRWVLGTARAAAPEAHSEVALSADGSVTAR